MQDSAHTLHSIYFVQGDKGDYYALQYWVHCTVGDYCSVTLYVVHTMYLERADEDIICTGGEQGSPLYVQYTMYNERAGVSIVCTLRGQG